MENPGILSVIVGDGELVLRVEDRRGRVVDVALDYERAQVFGKGLIGKCQDNDGGIGFFVRVPEINRSPVRLPAWVPQVMIGIVVSAVLAILLMI